VLTLGLLSWYGVSWQIYDFFLELGHVVAFALFLLGLSLMTAIACFFLRFVETLWTIVMRFAYLLSGVFFSADMLPKMVRECLLWNPVFQFVELSRNSFMPEGSYTVYASSSYLLSSGVITLFLGSALYLGFRQRIMTEIEQR
jgi:capsular polysaccharide transport system permease protein